MLDYPAPAWLTKRPNVPRWLAECSREQPTVGDLPRLRRRSRSYSGFFDLNSICHPYIGYQLFGENYKRSVFMVELKKSYRAEEFEEPAKARPVVHRVLRFAAHSSSEDVNDLVSKENLPSA